jgi:hypothetical protein
MAQFFQKLQAENKGSQPVEFFSDHPNPEHRFERVNEEVDKLGGSPRDSKTDSREFQDIKRYLLSRPAPPGKNSAQALQGPTGSDRSRRGTPSEWPSDHVKSFENSVLRIEYPDTWQPYGQGDAVTLAPRDGLVDDGNGNQALAYGVIINVYEPHSDRYGQPLQSPGYGEEGEMAMEADTDQLVGVLRQSNRNMRVVRSHEPMDVNGVRGLSTYLSNDSPVRGGGRETDWLVTLPCPEGLLFIVFTAPERDFQGYNSTFQRMLYSVRQQSVNSSSNVESSNGSSYSGSGTMTWTGRVDDYVELNIQGTQVSSRERGGSQTLNERVSFSNPLPRADVMVLVNKRNGRGRVSVVQQPNRSNNYTAIVKIDDEKGGADDYVIEMEWR